MSGTQTLVDGWLSQEQLGHQTAIVAPIYFSAKPSNAMVERLLRITLMDCHHFLPAEQVWAVVDGDARSARIVGQVAEDLAASGAGRIRVMALPDNLGKLGAMRQGMRSILRQQPHVRWLAVLDGDADHLVAVLPSLTRTAAFLAHVYGHDRVLAIGSRASRVRPMGWVRGELERLLDQLTLDALAYALAREGRALDLSQCLAGAVPDLGSGFKVYGRDLAELLFDGADPAYLTLSPTDYDRYGPETVTIVETVLAGGVLGELTRPTWDGQPTTSFGEFDAADMYGELLAWVWARLDLPLAAAARMFDNHRRELTLATASEGAGLLLRVRAHALGRLAAWRNEGPPPPMRPALPLL